MEHLEGLHIVFISIVQETLEASSVQEVSHANREQREYSPSSFETKPHA